MIKQLLPLLENADLTVTFSMKQGTLTLIVVPKVKLSEKGDKATSFKPIIISGTPEEVEKGWIEALHAPMIKLNGLLIDSKAFEASVDKEATNKAETAKKEANKASGASGQAKAKVAEKKPAELIKEYVAKGDAAFADKNYLEAQKSYEDALVHKLADKTITAKLQNAQRWVKAQANLEPATDIFKETPEVKAITDELHNEGPFPTEEVVEPEFSLVGNEETHEGPQEGKEDNDPEDFNLEDA